MASPLRHDGAAEIAGEPGPNTNATPPLRRLTLRGGHLSGWALLALVNCVLIEVRVPPADRVLYRVLHHVIDAAHLLLCGFLSFGAIALAERVAPNHRLARLGGLAVAAMIVCGLVLPPDLESFFARHTMDPPQVVVAAAGLALVGVHLAARFAARPRWRWILIATATVVAVVNGLVLAFDYPGVHLLAAWAAVIVGAAAATGAALPAWVTRAPTPRPSVAWIAGALVVAVSLAPMNASTSRDIQVLPSAVVAPFLGRLLAPNQGVEFQSGEWWSDRTNAPEVPPTNALRLPKDGIVILLTIDAMRADMLSSATEAELPELHALARESVRFTLARAPSPSTTTSFASLFTGKYYSQLYWTAPSAEDAAGGAYTTADDGSPHVLQVLRETGIPPITVTALHGFAGPGSPTRGFGEVFKTSSDYGSAAQAMKILLDQLRKREGPAFYFLHFIDAHAPYDRGGRHGTPKERYVRELARVDVEIGRLRKALRQSGRDDRTALIITADHGEAFGEHGVNYHAVTLYEELLRVPLLIRAPGATPRDVDTPVLLVDVGPTILDLFGAATPGTFMGSSLAPVLVGRPFAPTRPIAAESGRGLQALIFPEGVKAILHRGRGTVELYDLIQDPGETHNLADDERYMARGYVQKLRGFFETHRYKKDGYSTPMRRL